MCFDVGGLHTILRVFLRERTILNVRGDVEVLGVLFLGVFERF